MAATRADQAVLATDPTFLGRVQESMISAAIAVSNEAITTAFHRERATLAKAIMNNPASEAALFVKSVATDANVISDATVAGTVPLTAGNVAAQAALVTDAHLDAAVSGQYNSFFSIYD